MVAVPDAGVAVRSPAAHPLHAILGHPRRRGVPAGVPFAVFVCPVDGQAARDHLAHRDSVGLPGPLSAAGNGQCRHSHAVERLLPHRRGRLLGFALVGLHLPRRQARLEEMALARFIRFKRHAAMLCIALAGIAAWSFGHWFTDLMAYAGGSAGPSIRLRLLRRLLLALIFVDVILLSPRCGTSRLWPDSGFVIATIVLAILSLEGWSAVAHEVLAACWPSLRCFRRDWAGATGGWDGGETGISSPGKGAAS